MKRKLGSLLLSVILLLTIVGDVTAGSPTAVISAGSGSGNPGDTNISVPVRLNSQDGAQVAGLDFVLSFDSNRLNVFEITIGSAAKSVGKDIGWSHLSSDRVKVIIFGLNQNAIPNGKVANVIFKVLAGAAPGTSPLTLSNATASDPNGDGIAVRLNNGSFTVLSPPPSITPTTAPSDTPAATSTPTSAHTDTPIPTFTSTIAPTISPTPTVTPSIGPSPTGKPSTTPTPTKTDIPSASATIEIKPTSGMTPTLNPTTSIEASLTPIEGPPSSPTPHPEGEILSDHETTADATSTAMAGLEAAVAATSTALAVIGQEPTAGDGGASEIINWLLQKWDVLLLCGVALGATFLMAGLLLEVLRPKGTIREKMTRKERRL
jgi:hypothetical protein